MLGLWPSKDKRAMDMWGASSFLEVKKKRRQEPQSVSQCTSPCFCQGFFIGEKQDV